MADADGPTIISAKEAGAILGISPGRVGQLVGEGKLRRASSPGGTRPATYYQADVEALAAERQNGKVRGDVQMISRPTDVDAILEQIASDLKALRRALKAHDAEVRRQAIRDLGSSLIEGTG